MPQPWIYSLLNAASQATGLPWWLLYGVIEQESGFDPNSRSSCGALGLMQLMPASFPRLEPAALLDPATNVRLGSEFLAELIATFQREVPDERIKFGLASYNGGIGYVVAAQRLAAAAGADTTQWEAVSAYLGSARVNGKCPDVGQITDYVRSIWSRYQKRAAEPEPAPEAA